MKALDAIWNARQFEHEISYTKNLGLILQPNSFTDFQAHPDFAEAFRLWTQKDSFRGLDLARLWSLVLNSKHVLSKHVGSVAELGVYQGQSSAVLSFYAKKYGRKMYLADTFQDFCEQQFEENMGETVKAAFKDTSLEAAQNVVGDYAGNRWIVGMFPDSITQEMREDSYALVSIDCDIYEPIAEGLKFFWPRMTPGGIIFVHDYSSGYWPGATRAVDEFCANNSTAGSLLPDLAGSYLLVRNSVDHSETNRVNAELTLARANVAQLEEALANVRASLSWRLTEPLRLAKHHLRNKVRQFLKK